MQVLVEYVVYVSQVKIPMSGGDAAYQWICEEPSLTSRSDQVVGALVWPQKFFSLKLLTPKDSGRFTLASPSNRIHQMDSRNLCVPCFISCV